MKLIDRYVYAVTEHLPESTREDVSKELLANIEDMLPGNPSEADIREVLERLGNPRKLAEEYNQTKKYLIGPELYDNYFSVLKLVLGIVTSVLISITLLKWVLNPPVSGTPTEISISFITDIAGTVVQSIIQGSVWVTIVFALIERSGVNKGQIPFRKKKWSLDDLPTIPMSKKNKISRGETIFSMVATVFFTSFIFFQPQLIALYEKTDNGMMKVTPLFNLLQLKSYLFLLLVLAIFQLILFIWKFISNRWNVPLAIANAVNNFAVTILIIAMLGDKSLVNNDFVIRVSAFSNISQSQIHSIWNTNIVVITVIFIAITLWDTISAFFKCRNIS